MRLGLAALVVTLTACPADSDSNPASSSGTGSDSTLDCASARSEDACAAMLPDDGSSVAGCAWVELRNVDATCAAPPSDPVGTCIATEYQGDGCAVPICNDQADRLFSRPDGSGGFDVFETTLCGNEPVGFTLCGFGDDDPAGCGCLCEDLGGLMPGGSSSSGGPSSSSG